MAQDTNGQSAAWGGRTSGNRGLLGESGQRQEGGAPGRGDAPEIREGEYGPRWGGLAAKWSPGKSPKELGRRGGGAIHMSTKAASASKWSVSVVMVHDWRQSAPA